MTEELIYTKKLREQNAIAISERIQDLKGFDFNDIVYTFADIINSTFLSNLGTGKSREELKEQSDQMNDLTNSIIDVLNEKSQNRMQDMIVLTNLIMQAVETAASAAKQDKESEGESKEESSDAEE